MVATPYKLNVTLKRLIDGATQRETVTMSDVDGEYGVFRSTSNNFATVRGKQNEIVQIIDMSVVAAGVDTSDIRLWVSGKDTGEAVEGSAILNTINNRLPGGIAVKAGSTIQFKQAT